MVAILKNQFNYILLHLREIHLHKCALIYLLYVITVEK